MKQLTPRTRRPVKTDSRGWLARAADWLGEQVAPMAATRRIMARNLLTYTYNAANSDRLRKKRSGQSGSGDKHIDNITLERLRNYCRDLARNYSIA